MSQKKSDYIGNQKHQQNKISAGVGSYAVGFFIRHRKQNDCPSGILLSRRSAPRSGSIAARFRSRNDAGGERQSYRPKNRGLSEDSEGKAPFPPSEIPHDSFAPHRDKSIIVSYTL